MHWSCTFWRNLVSAFDSLSEVFDSSVQSVPVGSLPLLMSSRHLASALNVFLKKTRPCLATVFWHLN